MIKAFAARNVTRKDLFDDYSRFGPGDEVLLPEGMPIEILDQHFHTGAYKINLDGWGTIFAPSDLFVFNKPLPEITYEDGGIIEIGDAVWVSGNQTDDYIVTGFNEYGMVKLTVVLSTGFVTRAVLPPRVLAYRG